jgi:nucleotide-binding universal stress UspA family protein
VYKRILMATDGSGVSDQALHQAVMLAKTFNAELKIVCVIDRYSYDQSWWVSPGAFNSIVEGMRERAREVLDRAAVTASQAGVQARIAAIETAEGERLSGRIAKEGEEWPADLLVLGTHGRRGMDHVVLGSVAEGVVRSATAPVLLVRGR